MLLQMVTFLFETRQIPIYIIVDMEPVGKVLGEEDTWYRGLVSDKVSSEQSINQCFRLPSQQLSAAAEVLNHEITRNYITKYQKKKQNSILFVCGLNTLKFKNVMKTIERKTDTEVGQQKKTPAGEDSVLNMKKCLIFGENIQGFMLRCIGCLIR